MRGDESSTASSLGGMLWEWETSVGKQDPKTDSERETWPSARADGASGSSPGPGALTAQLRP